MRRTPQMLLALLLASASCGADDAALAVPERQIHQATTEVWRVESFGEVGQLSASVDGTLIASDDASNEVVALEAATGRIQWRVGGRGGGPNEYGRIGSLAVRDRDVFVVDLDRRRVNILGLRDGALSHSFSTQRAAGVPRHVCAIGADTLMLLVHPADTIWLMSISGAPHGNRANPVRDVDPKGVLTELVSSGGSGDACVFAAIRQGTMFVVYRDGRVAETALPGGFTSPRWIRTATRDSLSHDVLSTVDVEVSSGHIWLLRSGEGELRARLIDVYHLSSGSYKGTVELPFRTSQFAVNGNFLMARIRDSLGVSRISAFVVPEELLLR